MVGRRRLGPFAIAVGALALMVLAVAPPAHSLSFADELRTWTSNSPTPTGYFVLNVDEGYSNYVFHIEPTDGIPVAWVWVEVRNLMGDVQCRGLATYNADTLNVNRHCPGLRLQHHYQVTWMSERGGVQLTLSGYGSP